MKGDGNLLFDLRPYQSEAIEAIKGGFASGKNRLILSLPTAAGKTIVFCSLIKDLGVSTLVMVHRDELVGQTVDKLRSIWPGVNIGIVKAERNELGHQVTIASVQTLYSAKRLRQVGKFPLVIVDECHHGAAKYWRRAINETTGQYLLGVSATPFRTDNIGLKPLFEDIIYHRSILDLMIDDYLSDLRGIQVKTAETLDKVKVRAGDFVESSLSRAVNTKPRNNEIVKAYKTHAPGRQALCFAADMAHASAMAEAFESEGIKASVISGKTPLEERRGTISDFKAGKITIICNCAVMTEGVDLPMIGCIIMARPTRSRILYTQMVGRGNRIYPGKKDCIVLDMVDNTSKWSLVTLPELFETNYDEMERLQKERQAAAEKVDAEIEMRNSMSIMEFTTSKARQARRLVSKRVELFREQRLSWVELEKNMWALSVGEDGFIAIWPSEKDPDLYEVFLLPRPGEKVRLSSKPILLSWAYGFAEQEAQKLLRGKTEWLSRDAWWWPHKISPAQERLLDQLGLPAEGLTKGEASLLLSQTLARRRVDESAANQPAGLTLTFKQLPSGEWLPEAKPADGEAPAELIPASPTPELNELWQKVLGHLEQKLTRANFEAWVKGSVLLALEENLEENKVVVGVYNSPVKEYKVVVGVYDSPAKEYLESKLGSGIRAVILNILSKEMASRFVAVKPGTE